MGTAGAADAAGFDNPGAQPEPALKSVPKSAVDSAHESARESAHESARESAPRSASPPALPRAPCRPAARTLRCLLGHGLLACAAAVAVTPAAAAAAGPADERPAHGLIVRLKDAAPHGSAFARLHAGDGERLQQVLRASALPARDAQPAWRATGRDQQLLDFGRVLDGAEAAALAARLRARPEVDWVAPNVREKLLALPTDPLVGQQWWLRAHGGTDAHALADRLRGVPGFLTAWTSGLPGATGRASAVVAVLDTGITAHPDLAGRVLPGYDFVSEVAFSNDGDGRDADPADPGDWVSAADRSDPRYAGCDEQASSWHGTLIAGMLAAGTDNGTGVAAINHDGRVLPVRVAGKCGATVADIVDGMRWAAGLNVPGVPRNPNPARILNISFGGSTPCGREYQTAIDELRAIGVVVVAAAGNEHGAVARPANCNGVVGVTALNRDGFKTHYANFGAVLAASGIATVGGDDDRGGAWAALLADSGLVSVWNDGTQGPGQARYAALFGTSFATPVVAGTLGLMLSVNPALTAGQLVDGLRASARPHVVSPHIGACSNDNPGRCLCSTATCGAGILDAAQALQYASQPDSYVAPPRQAARLDSAELRNAAALGPDRPPNAPAPSPGSGGGGGGASGPGWLLALFGAVLALRRAGACPSATSAAADRARPQRHRG